MFLVYEDLPKKSPRELKEQITKELTCTLDGCSNPLTQRKGPGQTALCKKHQKLQREFGGPGRLDRPWTFHRKWVCDGCGVDVTQEVSRIHPGLEDKDPVLFMRLVRSRVIGDHQIRQVDGGDDSEENIKSYCLNCNSDKTILSEDYRNKG